MSDLLADASMACSRDIWELKLFLWTSADMPAWNDVLLEMNTPTRSTIGLKTSGLPIDPLIAS